ncbi:hypothetical protein [Mesorhizobium sp. A556]
MPSIKLGDVSAEIIDPGDLLPVYADLVADIRILDGVLHLTLATLVVEGFGTDATHKARVCAKLRVAPTTLQFIQNVLAAPREEAPPPGQRMN